jgi:transglutaminase-like putative cysteine protease
MAERHVGCHVGFDVAEEGVSLVLQVAPAAPAEVRDEHLVVAVDGVPLEGIVTEVAGAHGGRLHVVRSGPGALTVDYACAVRPPAAPGTARGPADLIDLEALTYLRQSRYCPSDELLGFAGNALRDLPAGPDLPRAIASWVFERLVYDLNTSGPFTTAIDTLAANAGACRDFAHLTIALCRARGVPARLAAVYAPGLFPMDFHAVVEARVGGAWQVLDPTRLAPRSSLIRIATGRDAADTAFATTLAGDAEMLAIQVTATTDGDLPLDDHAEVVSLA